MKPLLLALIEDEPGARNMVRILLGQHCPHVQIVGEAGSVKAGIELLKTQRPQIVLLDVDLGDGTGFDLLDRIPKPDFRTIFITGHDEFALRAFRYSAVDYLLKPVQPHDLASAISRASKTGELETALACLEQLMDIHRTRRMERIALTDAEGLHLLPLARIIRLKGEGSYTTFHLDGGERHIATRSIGEFEDLLPPDQFFRTHQSHIVNLDHVRMILRREGGGALMSDGEEVPVARRRKEEFLERLGGGVER